MKRSEPGHWNGSSVGKRAGWVPGVAELQPAPAVRSDSWGLLVGDHAAWPTWEQASSDSGLPVWGRPPGAGPLLGLLRCV